MSGYIRSQLGKLDDLKTPITHFALKIETRNYDDGYVGAETHWITLTHAQMVAVGLLLRTFDN